jgi:succinyl-CoA synthetase beta subunit
MKIHEYQARNLFRKYGIPVPDGVVCHSVEEVKKKMCPKPI